MAIVKMVRDLPEVAGGKTTADIPEEAVQSAIDNGWRIAEKNGKGSGEDELGKAPDGSGKEPNENPQGGDSGKTENPANAKDNKPKGGKAKTGNAPKRD